MAAGGLASSPETPTSLEDRWTPSHAASAPAPCSSSPSAASLLLLLLIIRLRLHAFIALILVSLLDGVATGIPVGDLVVPTLLDGFGTTLAAVALLVGLGAMLGRLLEVSGGARCSRTPSSAASARSGRRWPWAWPR